MFDRKSDEEAKEETIVDVLVEIDARSVDSTPDEIPSINGKKNGKQELARMSKHERD